MKKTYRYFLLFTLLLPLCLLSACDDQKADVYVDPGKTAPANPPQTTESPETGIRLGIGSIITPKEGYI
jgi:hypothetical protein